MIIEEIQRTSTAPPFCHSEPAKNLRSFDCGGYAAFAQDDTGLKPQDDSAGCILSLREREG